MFSLLGKDLLMLMNNESVKPVMNCVFKSFILNWWDWFLNLLSPAFILWSRTYQIFDTTETWKLVEPWKLDSPVARQDKANRSMLYYQKCRAKYRQGEETIRFNPSCYLTGRPLRIMKSEGICSFPWGSSGQNCLGGEEDRAAKTHWKYHSVHALQWIQYY